MEGRGGQVPQSGPPVPPRARAAGTEPPESAASGERGRRARLLVAVTLGGSVGSEVEGLRRSLADPAAARIGPHLTLVPPVDVRLERLVEAAVVVERAASSAAPFCAYLGPVRSFAPRTPVVYLAWSEELGNEVWPVTASLREGLLSGPLDRPASRRRPFVPHVTICRRMAVGEIPAAVRLLSGYRAEVEVTSLAVLVWADEGRWVERSSVPLGGGQRRGRGGVDVAVVVHWLGDAPLSAPWPGVGAPPRRLALLLRPEGATRELAGGSDEPVAVLDGLVGAGTLWVLDLQVRPALEGMGLGRRLVIEAEAVARAEGCASMELSPPLADRLGTDAASALGFRSERSNGPVFRRYLGR